jgi:NADP-dependent 3-hydroxy acid dehydrogenase YdfG
MVAVITGSSKGIGKALAFKYGENGFDLALCARGIEHLNDLKNELIEKYPTIRVMVQAVDMADKVQVKSFGESVLKAHGRVDILINNAGIYLPGDLLSEDDETLPRMIDTNLYSAYHMTRALVPSMVTVNNGHIVNMCSIASQIALPGGGSYSISKFALLGFSKVLREELKQTGVKVTSVMPGATWSDSWTGVDLPYERLMEARDIADTIFSATSLGKSAVVEEIIIRPQLGDL